MSKKTAPSSRAPQQAPAPRRRPPRERRAVDVRGWLGGIRLSGFMVVMMGLVVLAAFVLVPTIGTYLAQRQQVMALEQAVQLSRDEVVQLEAQRDRWKDPAYITTQARERLYYVKPGEVIYLVDDDLPASETPHEQAPVSEDVERTRSDWMTQLVRSVTGAGLAQSALPPPSIGIPDEPVTETPSDGE